MTGISQSALLQALGWATLNSFWQVGLLWCGFVVLRRFVAIDARRQYQLAVFALALAFLAFVVSLLSYLSGLVQPGLFPIFNNLPDHHWFQLTLTAASISYLLLLTIPALQLVQNWRLLRRLRRSKLAKAPVAYRLYVQRIAGHLGIRRKVQVQLSALVQSPLTIGFLKPLILLPVAAFNQLSPQQAEAILLHEVAHIRRCDYLVNIVITIIHTLLYFNPFVRLFARAAEAGREECCDALVLQFGYNPHAYAEALFRLEQSAASLPQLAMGATGKSQLLARIEAIAGMPRRVPALKLRHFTGLLASVLSMCVLHAVFVTARNNGAADPLQAIAQMGRSMTFALAEAPAHEDAPDYAAASRRHARQQFTSPPAPAEPVGQPEPLPPPPPEPAFQPTPVGLAIAPIEELEPAQQAKVMQTVATTRRVLETIQWKEVEQQMADVLTSSEKAAAQQQYHEMLRKMNWAQMEQNLASQYNNTNWEQLNAYLEKASRTLELDSMETHFTKALAELQAAKIAGKIALPDEAAATIDSLHRHLKIQRDSIRRLRETKVYRF